MGYSLIELLVAMSISLSIIAGGLTILDGLQRGYAAEGERADLQQRLRAAVETLARDLALAGAGAVQAADAGALGLSIPAVLPFRQGAAHADPPGTFRSDVITLLSSVSVTSPQTTLRQSLAAQSGPAFINLDSGCPPGDPACGLGPGMDVLVYDQTGAYETFRLDAAASQAVQLRHTMSDTAQTLAAGARMVEARSRTYYTRVDPATDAMQLMREDGVSSEEVVVDHLVGLSFEYYGEAAPPRLLKPVADPVGPWTTYGPRPPPLDVGTTAYGAGGNCVFQVDPPSGLHTPRLATLGNGSLTLVALTAAQLTDGPWCPDAASAHRYDADLLRIRRVSVQLRLEAALAALRGPAGQLFARAGTARGANRWLPDQQIRFDVSPRNMNAGR